MLGKNAARVTCSWPDGRRDMAWRIVIHSSSKFVPEEDTSDGGMQMKRIYSTLLS
jgi:hypothetical protein